MRRFWLILLSVAVLAPAGCGRGRSAGTGQVFRYPITIEPSTLDPARLNDIYTTELLENIYEGLVTFDRESRIVPCLAERWDISPDGRTYTFHLNPRARFHNGRPAGAEDVKYSLERALWPETRSPVAPNYLGAIVGANEITAGKRKDLAGVRVVDAHTLAITIDRPRGYFLGMLAYPTGWVVCKEAIAATGGRFDEGAVIGTGPFKLASYRHGSKVILEANPDYYGGRPRLDHVERPIVLDYQTAHIQYENNESDFCAVALNDYVGDLKRPGLKEQSLCLPYADVTYLSMHPGLQPAFKKPGVRRAFALAIDRDAISRIACRGVWPRADSFLPPGLPGCNAHFRRIPYDPAMARKLLADSGYPGGADFPKLTLVYIEKMPEVAAAAGLIRDNLKENLGVVVNLEEREAATFIADTSDHEKIPFYLIGWIADYPDPQDFLSTLLHTGASLNHVAYSNARFDALCDRADAESDMAKRIPLYQQADQIAMDDVAVLPIYYQKLQYLQKPYVRDLEINVMMPLPLKTARIQR